MTGISMQTIRRWHRQLGIFVALFLILLSITGIAVNHSEQFDLSSRYVPGWIATFYLDSETVLGLEQGDRIYYAIGDTLYANRIALTACSAFTDKATFEQQEIMLCNAELVLFTSQLQLIERIDVSKGLPVNVDMIEATDEQLLVRGDGNWFAFDLLNLVATPASSPPAEALHWVAVPDELLLREAVSWQQFLLDVHSGAVAGFSGKLFMDLVGALIILMALSGIVMWQKSWR
jgi:hypothetical protein